MLVTEEAFYDIVQTTWTSTLGFLVYRSPEAVSAIDGALAVGVKVTGAWEGEVRLQCSRGLAELIAAAIYQLEAGKATDHEVFDALSELAHIIGGNLKALLPKPVTLSLPTLLEAGVGAKDPLNSQAVYRLGLSTEGHTFAVTLYESLPGSGTDQSLTGSDASYPLPA